MAKNWNKWSILDRTGLFLVVAEFDTYDEAREYLLIHSQENASWYIMRGSAEYHIKVAA